MIPGDERPGRGVEAGVPDPEAEGLTWSERGLETGAEEEAPPDLAERLAGAAFLAAWRLVGLLALPAALLHPGLRRHVVGLPAPEPGWNWLHGASAGEHLAARALAPYLAEGAWRTSLSPRTPVAGAFPAPLDLPFVVGRWLDRARPARLILVESELWPGWIAAARARGIPVAVVNARPSRGTARWRRLGPLWRWLTRGVRFIPQSETGDLKLAARLGAATFELGRDAFIAASTRPGDEERVIAAWKRLPERIGRLPRPMLVLAPRHLDRVPEVARLLDASGLRWARRTAGWSPDVDVLLLDTLGELATLFPQARAAFVGGTFDARIGGHSPAEAFLAGLPVVHGPHTHANPEAWSQGIALAVPEGPDLPERLAKAIRSALSVGPRAVPANESAMRAAALLPEPRTPRETPARPWLRPLVPAWRVLHALAPSRRLPPEPAGGPVVSVGALSAGGAGKTPVAGWLAERIPGAWVVGRGYRRGGDGGVRVGLPGEPPAAPLGDELEMLRRRGVPVVSAPDRLAGAREAFRRGARLVVLDDGFGHRRLARDLDVLCIDARWPDGRGPIPVGTRREPWSAARRAGVLWLHHAPDGEDDGAAPRVTPLPGQLLVRSRLRPAGWLVAGRRLPLEAVTGEVDVAVGIARPEGFFSALLRLGLTVRSWRVVRDHGALDPAALPEGCVVTEKDAARLPPDAPVRALLVDLEVEGAEPLLARLRALAAGEGPP